MGHLVTALQGGTELTDHQLGVRSSFSKNTDEIPVELARRLRQGGHIMEDETPTTAAFRLLADRLRAEESLLQQLVVLGYILSTGESATDFAGRYFKRVAAVCNSGGTIYYRIPSGAVLAFPLQEKTEEK